MIPTAQISNEANKDINWASFASLHATHSGFLSQVPVTYVSLFQENKNEKECSGFIGCDGVI
ncbi:hypothetical protein [Aeromonas enterica]